MLESSIASKRKRTRVKKQEVLLRWSFPPNGWYKLNVDGTYRGGSGCIAAGGVIRNQNGEWVSGFAANLGRGTKALEAELWALYRGLELALDSGWAPIMVESDSAGAVKLLFDPIEMNWKHKQFNLILGCQNLLNQRWRCSLNHVYREQNGVADCMASFGLTLEMGCHYFDAPPPLCHPLLVRDQCRVAQPRFLRPSVIGNRTIKKLGDVEEDEENLKSVIFTWKIDNFSKLDVDKHYSDFFVIGVFQWRIVVFPRGNNVDDLSVYLDVTGSSTLPSGWARYAKFSLSIVNQVESSKSIAKDTEHMFTKRDSYSGFTSLIRLSEFSDSNKGYLVNDTCIVVAKVAVHKAEIKILKDLRSSSAPFRPSDKEYTASEPSNVQALVKCTSAQTCSKPTEIPAGPPMIKEHEDVFSTPDTELMDFRGLGKIDKTFVPLLDEVCSCHPSLIECQSKRSRMFTEWAFTALGRLLHFLKTNKVKDMTKDTCVQQLKLLWEELAAFGFDLGWLQPCVERALGMKKMAERAGQLKRMREDVDALQIQTKRLRAALDVAEVNLESATINLDKYQQDFHVVDMDSELGYWTVA